MGGACGSPGARGDRALLRSVHGLHFVGEDPSLWEGSQEIHIHLEVTKQGKLLFTSDSGYTRSKPAEVLESGHTRYEAKEVEVWWTDTVTWRRPEHWRSGPRGQEYQYMMEMGMLEEGYDEAWELERPTWIFKDSSGFPWCILHDQEHPTIQCLRSLVCVHQGEKFTEPKGQKLRGHRGRDDHHLDELLDKRELADIARAESELSQRSEISQEVRERARKVLEGVKELRQLASDGTECSFYFVLAEHVRSCQDATLPPFQQLQRERPECLVKRTLRLKDACSGAYVAEILAISHRWETSSVPDVKGIQMESVRKHLREHAEIQLVWYDYWCMPQGERSDCEKREFKLMLPNINMLYLGCSVLLLVDLSYMSRFWTEFEAWLSMQVASKSGLCTSTDKGGRCTISTIHSAPPMFERFMLDMWAGKSVEEAYAFLAQPDVTVTNQGDKDLQLSKLAKLSELVQTVLADT